MLKDLTRVLGPEDGVAVRRRPPQVARVELADVLVERGLGLGVLVEQLAQPVHVLAQVRVGELARLEVLEQGGEAGEDGGGQERVLVVNEEVEEGRDEEAGGFFFGGEAQELGVEEDDVVFAGECQPRGSSDIGKKGELLVQVVANVSSLKTQLPHHQQHPVQQLKANSPTKGPLKAAPGRRRSPAPEPS